MTRRLPVKQIQVSDSMKDESGAYVRPPEVPMVPTATELPPSEVSLDDLLSRQLLALERVTKQLVLRASAGDMTKAEIDSLATCIDVTMKLKIKEKDLLDSLTTEELEALASGK